MKISIIGCGFVGLITAVGFASKGNLVKAIDIDQARLSEIRKGRVPFYEEGVEKLLKTYLNQENLSLSSSLEDVDESEVVFICVQTPPQLNGAIDLKILMTAVKDLADVFKKSAKSRIVVIRSTVIPGTTENMIMPIFQQNGNLNTEIVFNPEFLREGSALSDFLNPDRIVIGTNSAKAGKVISKLYTPFNAPIIITTPSTAELSKYASNALLATLISYSNEIAKICERTPNTDVEDVLGIVHLDRRFKILNGEIKADIVSYLKAGCGFGGSCLPKDLSALIAYAQSIKEEPFLLKAVAHVNKYQPKRLVKMVLIALGGLENKKIAVLGVAFKGGTDDLRDSPGLKIVDELLEGKAKVTIFDPLVVSLQLQRYKDKGVIIASSLKEAIEDVDVCIITSNASEFRSINKYLRNKKLIIIDGRRILKSSKKIKIAKTYYAIGLPKERIYIS